MASIPAGRNADTTTPDTLTAGGKIMRNRRPPPSSRTPYSRPSPPPEVVEEDKTENPNWLSNLIYPAKFIASGANKILSFFGNEYSSDDDDDSENDADDEELDDGENGGSDKAVSPSCQSDKKRKVEQLVMEETFSREEGNQLIKLVKSRTVDTNGTFGVSTPPARTTAIMEARKWLQEKRSGSKKQLETDLDLASSQMNRSEKGSPADMAKSYMQNRPAWASPSLKPFDFGSPSTLGMLHFKEETPNSTVRSSEMKRSSFSSGSWNLLEEIRRVRTKATEELLAGTPLTKTKFSLFSSKNDPPRDILETKGAVDGADVHVRTDNVVQPAAANSLLRENQDVDAVQSVELEDSLEAADLKSNKDFDVNELRSTAEINGFVSSTSGIVEGQHAAEEPMPSKGENGTLVSRSQGEPDIRMDKSDQLAEPGDVPSTNPTDIVVNGSQTSSSMQDEDLSQELSQPVIDSPSAKAKDVQRGRKTRGYSRRGRGRGK